MVLQNEKRKRYIIILLLLVCCAATDIFLYFYLGGYSAYDLKGHWKISAYTLKGYDPFSLIGQPAIIESIGKIPKGFSTVPWSCVFGNVFYPGFLTLAQAKIYIWILQWVILAVTAGVIYHKLTDYCNKKVCILLISMMGVHFSFMYSLHYGNIGSIICCLLIMVIFLADSNPYISGILLGFAMMKPQIAALVCLILLVNRKWKSLLIGAVIDFAGWGATCVVTNTKPLVLLKETFTYGMKSDKQYLGLLTLMENFHWGKNWILLLNVVIGIAYSSILWHYLKTNCDLNKNELILYAPACVASTFWIYKNGTDYMILAYVAACFGILCMKSVLSKRDFWISLWCIAYLEMSRCVVYIGIMISKNTGYGRNLCKSIDGFFLGTIGIILCILWVKYKKWESVCYKEEKA